MPEWDATYEDRLLSVLGTLEKLPLHFRPQNLRISPPLIGLLMRLDRSPGMGVREIADELHVTPPTISVAIQRMINDGWIEIIPDPNDRRSRPLYLTEQGRAMAQQILQHRNQVLHAFLEGLNEDEREQLVILLERATKHMKASLST